MATPSTDIAGLLSAGFESLRLALDERRITSVELTEECLRRAVASQPILNSLISICEDEARTAARAADQRLDAGERNPVLGMPIIVKDLILCKGTRTTAASKMLENFIAPYDASVVLRLKKAGAPLLAKSNLDEFAMGSSNETSYFGAVKNPWDLTRVPGGSSGGSAAAVAGGLSLLSLGTDTGGSIRQPSSFCGLMGIKPTYGRVSRYGVVAYASSLDQVGPMCSDVFGAAAVLDAISGHCERDGTSLQVPPTRAFEAAQTARLRGTLDGLRIGLPQEYFDVQGLDSEVRNCVEEKLATLKALGAQLIPVSLPHTKYAIATYYLIATSEASSNLSRYDGVHFGHRSPNFHEGTLDELYSMNRGEGFGKEVKLRILLGTYALSAGYYDAYYRKASQVRELIRRDFEKAFLHCDVIASPTSPTTAFSIAEKVDDPVAMYLADVYTLSANLAGIPALSMNAGFDSRALPIGIQFMGPWLQEEKLFEIASILESSSSSQVRLSPVHQRFSHEMSSLI
jgi:aspartyl-tRNA(Asn)/glutamyl-tRNA(Gln) amidotransferase subunit A